MLKNILAVFVSLLVVPAVYADGILIRSVTILDGTGKKTGPTDVEISGKLISKIGENLKSRATTVIDGSGKTLTPGLIDAHSHVRTVPGFYFRNDSEEEIRRQQLLQLKAYLAAGVTTVLDCAAPESLLKEVKDLENKGHSPTVLGLAPFLTPKDGYFSDDAGRGQLYKDLWPAIDNEATLKTSLQQAAALKPVGTKVTMESGFGPFKIWPVFDEKMRQNIVTEAAAVGLPIFVHSMTEAEHRLALTLKPYALVHAGFNEAVASKKIVEEIKQSGAYVITTLAIYRSMLLMFEPDFINQTWVKNLVPPEQIKTALDESVRHKVTIRLLQNSFPWWIPNSMAGLLSKFFFTESILRDQFINAKKSIRLLQDAQVPVVMGSDSGNWPLWTTFFHGVGSILEMEALQASGLSGDEVLISATSRAAKMLKIDDHVGTIAPGMVADLILLNQDPLTNPEAYRDLALVIKNGVAKKPLDWLK